ncbi:hypothetical protein [Paraburkholderia sp. CNPSo 3281]|uniref:hypothetical protein n=1 Tax=Paraburkholderia sp. CNPSo 3281 TaxID=2940933 RepID=UPI0020B70C28|nr:hypothetical protein [Paraburkholderia sp. CNPSo 3281]MCP3716563.1 hypothetical protein [Paraburkholderia sp. CNPSo 3281]
MRGEYKKTAPQCSSVNGGNATIEIWLVAPNVRQPAETIIRFASRDFFNRAATYGNEAAQVWRSLRNIAHFDL